MQTVTKEYVRPMSPTWWLERWAYTKFMIRDITSIFIAAYCVFLMMLLYRANQSAEAFAAFYQSLQTPWAVAMHLIALVFAVIHSVTFFNLTPRVIVVFRGDEKVPEAAIAGLHYALWAIATLALVLIAMW